MNLLKRLFKRTPQVKNKLIANLFAQGEHGYKGQWL
jgi:hypothetical protein